MSRAFVKETDELPPDEDAPLAVSAHPPWITAAGWARVQAELAQVQQELAALPVEDMQHAATRDALARRLRGLRAQAARVRVRVPGANTQVDFGHRVRVSVDGAAPQTWWLVGESEADVRSGRLSWTSPLAQALLGAQVGDIVSWPRPAGEAEVEVLAIETPPEAENAADRSSN